MTENDEGGYLIPHECVYGGWIYRPVPRTGWRRIFVLIGDGLHLVGYYFMRAGQIVTPYEMVREEKRIKGILAEFKEQEETCDTTRYDLPQEPYDDLIFGGEYDHDLR